MTTRPENASDQPHLDFAEYYEAGMRAGMRAGMAARRIPKTNLAQDRARQLPKDIQFRLGLGQMQTALEVRNLRSSGMLPRDTLLKICSPEKYGYTDDTYCTWTKHRTANCLKCRDLDILKKSELGMWTNQTVVGVVELRHVSQRGRVVSAHGDGRLFFWTPPGDARGAVWTSSTSKSYHHSSVLTTIVELSSGHIVCGFVQGTICVWTVDTTTNAETPLSGMKKITRPGCGAVENLVAFGSDSNASFAFSDAAGNQIFVYGAADNSQDWSCTSTLIHHTKRINSLIVLASGQLVSASLDGTVCVWTPRPENSEEERWKCDTLEPKKDKDEERTVDSVAELSFGRIASSYNDGTVCVWTEDEGRGWTETATLEYAKGQKRVMALGTSQLMCWSSIDEIRVWKETSPENGEWNCVGEPALPPGVEKPVNFNIVGLGPETFVATCTTGIVVFMQRAVGWSPIVLKEHNHKQISTIVAISGGRIAVGFYDGDVHVRTLKFES